MRMFPTVSKKATIGWLTVALITLNTGAVFAQFVQFDVVDGSPVLSGAVAASNTFSKGFFWDFKSPNLSRAGFEDGTVHPYMQYPHWYKVKGARAEVTEHEGHDTALKCYWSPDARNPHFEIRGFSNARDELWWSFDLYVPEADPDDPDAPSFPDRGSTVISQIWHKGVGPMMVALKIENNNLKIMNHGGPSVNVAVKDIPRGAWNKVIFQVIPSLAGNGGYKLWYGGNKVVDKSGIKVTAAGAGEDDFTDDDRMVEGQYMDPWFGLYGKGNKERTLFFDNVISHAANKDDSALRVEAENYDRYEDNTDGNQGVDHKQGGYRPSEHVDIGFHWKGKKSFGYKESAYYVGWMENGEWLEYDIVIPETGTYNFNYQVDSPDGKGKFKVSLKNKAKDTIYKDGINIGRATEYATDGIQGWTTLRRPPVYLEAGGDYTLIVEVEKGGFKLDWWEADFAALPKRK